LLLVDCLLNNFWKLVLMNITEAVS